MAVLLSDDVAPTTLARVRPWLWFNLLSLDAPLVAVAWQLWFAHCFQTPLPLLSVVALAATVWIIYVSDRLLDVRHAETAATNTDRHRFHRRHMAGLWLAVVLSFAGLSSVAGRLNPTLVRNGLILSGFVLLYFVAVHTLPRSIARLLPKELAVGTVFAVGSALAPWSRLQNSRHLLAPVTLFAILCFLNCSAIDAWEWRRLGARSSIRPQGVTLKLVEHLSLLATLVAVAGFVLLITTKAHTVFAAIIISAVAFVWLNAESERLPISLLRVLADAPLLSPLLLLGLH